MAENINIIGAGIGGLTTALILKNKGLDVKIFESAAEIKPVGAGIIIANNAMQVFQKLGIQDKIEKAGNKISYMKITDMQLNHISVINLTEYEKKYGVCNIAIHRGELQKILANEIGYEHINLSKKLLKIEKNTLYKLTFDDSSEAESKFIIGADGIKSIVRTQLFEKSTLRNANQKCWRGICDIDLHEKYHRELNEALGKGKRFGFVKISQQKVYWYALINTKNISQNKINLLELFDDFHLDILKIIAATDKEKIIESDIIDLKPIANWHKENACLIGDAAHATTPNMGQGACQAVEDAYVLGRLLESGMSVANAFSEYEKLRKKKALYVVNASWTLGKIAHWENSLAVKLRNFILKVTPEAINKKQMNKIFELN